MFFGMVHFLPVLLTLFSSHFATTLAGCDWKHHSQKSIKGQSVSSVHDIASIDACRAECQTYNGNQGSANSKCNAVSHNVIGKVCFLYSLPGDQSENDYVVSFANINSAVDTCAVQPVAGTPAPPAAVAPPGPSSSHNGCGKQDSNFMPTLGDNIRITRGHVATPHTWPWMLEMTGGCGASLIPVKEGLDSSDMILTASHCFEKPSSSNDYTKHVVMAGKHDILKIEDSEVRENVAEVRYYDEASPYEEHDIALARLKSPIKFTQTIKPVCLPTANEPAPIDKKCFATGWGLDKGPDAGNTHSLLKQVPLTFHDEETCTKRTGRNYFPSHICAGDGAGTVCKGDSGGPLVYQHSDNAWVQYGIASLSGCDETPALYTRVQNYADWIQKTINEMSVLTKS